MTKQGIYIHVPFCKSRCIYCDFFSTTFGGSMQDDFVSAVSCEASYRQHYLAHTETGSVYIGGGTPSALSERNIGRLLYTVQNLFDISPDAEITVEVNPNDVRPSLIETMKRNGVNRISMGIQSFNDNMLRFLHRRHSSQEAITAIDTIINGGIENISIDLIYGLPEQTVNDWDRDLNTAFSLPISHLSAYSLMFEDGTRLSRMRDDGIIKEVDEEICLQMFGNLMRKAKEESFNHYEISNFSLPGKQARHNTGYWTDMHYLGLGPGAHSYNGISRQQNICDLKAYVKAYGDTAIDPSGIMETETLSMAQKKEEALLISLRTAQGLDLHDYALRFGQKALNGLLERAKPFINDGRLLPLNRNNSSFADAGPTGKSSPKAHTDTTANNYLALSTKGIFVSDYIITSLFE